MSHHWVADIGCGPGYFSIPFAKYLFDGKLFALDIQKEMLDATQEALKAARLTNTELILSKETKIPIEDEVLDGAITSFVLQEASRPSLLLKEAKRCLKKSGWLIILEWHKREMDEGPPLSQRISEDELRKMTDKLGFRFRALRNLNSSQYMMLVRK
jgi:ubiquinone/menaquinone biosynthesis C-methylase UbiE